MDAHSTQRIDRGVVHSAGSSIPDRLARASSRGCWVLNWRCGSHVANRPWPSPWAIHIPALVALLAACADSRVPPSGYPSTSSSTTSTATTTGPAALPCGVVASPDVVITSRIGPCAVTTHVGFTVHIVLDPGFRWDGLKSDSDVVQVGGIQRPSSSGLTADLYAAAVGQATVPRLERWPVRQANPVGEWVTQQARNLSFDLAEQGRQAKFLIRDRDAKFTASFDGVFATKGIRVIATPIRSPRANAFAERFIGTVRRECLDRLLVFHRAQLEAVPSRFFDHYNGHRPSPLPWTAGPARSREGAAAHQPS